MIRAYALRIVFLCFLFSALCYVSYSQETASDQTAEDESLLGEVAPSEETPDAAVEEAEAEIAPESPKELSEEELAAIKEKTDANKLLDLEIKTSTLSELAEWCRELGISEGGSRNDLIARLRSHFDIKILDQESSENQKIITITSARATEYFTINSVNEEYARLSGGVELNLTEGDAIHKVKAWEIIFNRTRNVLTANGNVEYVKEEGGTLETFKGDSITINLDTWAGSFIDTISERSISGSETAYKFAGQVISKTDAETTVLSKARVTNAKTDEPYWSLDASKLWILPGSDWALFNGVLKVGEIPVLWVPFFFLPADELIFHPVLGTRLREGYFLQTTTYILGKQDPSLVTDNSISKILGSGAGMEKVREGVYLRTTGKKEQTEDTRRLALLLDAYTNLGFYIGTEMSMPSKGVLSAWNLSAGIAFTRTIYNPAGTYYSPFDTEPEVDQWNKSHIFGLEVPFRYRLKSAFSVSGKYGSMSLNLPAYSDPFIDYDVMTRTENMDWMEMLRDGSARQTVDTVTTIGSYQWELKGTPTISTSALSPYISSLSINSISSVFHINYKDDSVIMDTQPFSPERTFFYPDRWTLFSISGSVSGTPFSLSSATSVAEKDKPVDDPLKPFGVPQAPWPVKTPEENTASKGSFTKEGGYILKPPDLKQTFNIAPANGLRLSWNYSLSPTMSSELYYSSGDWLSSEDADLGDIKSILMSIRTDGSTNITLSETNNNLFSISGSIRGSVQWQDHVYRNLEAEEYASAGGADPTDAEKLNDYRSSNWTTSWEHNTQINPLYWISNLKTTNLQYSLSGLLAKSNFTGTSDDPIWEVIYGEWNKDDINGHRISTNIGLSLMEKMQNLSFYADLPPKDSSVSINGTTRFWITETNANTIIKNPFEGEPEYQAANFTETLSIGSGRLIKQFVTYDPKYTEVTNITTTLNFDGFSFSYNAARSPGYKLAYNASGTSIIGWQSGDQSEAKLRPLSMRTAYSQSIKQDSLWDKRLGVTLSTSIGLNFDLQRYTYTKLTFDLSGTLRINNFIDFTMGTTSENNQMFFYLSELPFFDENAAEIKENVQVYEDNFFIDLFNSFRFDNEDIRRKSGFKLKNFRFSTTHHLGDWDASLTVSMLPWRPADATSPYRFITNVSFVLQWLPISELRTELTYDGQEDIFTSK